MNKVFLAFMCVCITLAPVSLRAEEALPDGFFKFEGAGLLLSQKDGSLGDGVWDGSQRAHITKLIRDLPVSTESYTAQRLIDAVLLGKSDTKALEGAKDVTAGDDLLTLRLNKLIEGGRYKAALELYTAAAGETPYHPKLARTGILSMLGSSEKSLACVEAKIFDNQGVEPGFWNATRAYCDYTLSESPSDGSKAALDNAPTALKSLALNKDFQFTYGQAAYSKLSALEHAALIAEQKIASPALSAEQISSLPQGHLAALLAMDDIKGEQKLRLSIRAAALGLIDGDALGQAYKTHDDQGSPLPRLYSALIKAEDTPEKTAIFGKALALEGKYGIAALLPFGQFIDDVIFPAPNPAQMNVILQLSHRIKNSIPAKLITNFLKNMDENDPKPENLEIIYKLNSAYFAPQSQELSKIVQKNSLSGNSSHFFLINVIENLDKPASDVDNAGIVYEKDFALTTQVQHVMPSYALWNHLNTVADDKFLGETVLLSAFVLHEQNMGKLYPGLVRDIVRNLNRVGLSHISRDLAVEALLLEKQKKE